MSELIPVGTSRRAFTVLALSGALSEDFVGLLMIVPDSKVPVLGKTSFSLWL